MQTAPKEYVVQLISITSITPDVKQYRVKKPQGYTFQPGQATDVAINTPALKDDKRPFTFTGLNEWEELEFIIKTYPDHHGVTAKLADLVPGDELIIGEPWGAITYQGQGTFIAGGAGVTPFIAIFRALQESNGLEGNRLLFSNKTLVDVILHEELRELLGANLIVTLTDEHIPPYENRMMDRQFLEKYIGDRNGHFYVCGPPGMMKAIGKTLNELKVGEEMVVVEM